MISSMSYSPQPEIFAKSLSHRLQSLAPERLSTNTSVDGIHRSASSPEIDECHETFVNGALAGNKEDTIRKLLERGLRTCDGYVVKMSTGYPLPGTTFPPTRAMYENHLRAKFQSDSDFFNTLLKNRRNSLDSASQSLVNDNTISKTTEPVNNCEPCDSDLFFDFDIGSPEQPDSDDDHHVINVLSADFDIQNENCTEHTKNRHSPVSSTAYGSTSSGLFSDQGTLSPPDRSDMNGRLQDFGDDFISLALDKSSSVTPVGSSPTCRSPPIDVPLAGKAQENQDCEDIFDLEGVQAETETSPSRCDDQDDFKVTIGCEEKSVAHSKLQALLAQLEKSTLELPTEKLQSTNGLRPMRHHSRTSSHANHSSSPANFSFLVGSVPNPCPEDESFKPLNYSRCQSTPELTEFDRERCTARAVPKPEEAARATSPVTSSEDEEKKKMYRKSSSLKSGKTPPCTPGRRKIVRFADVFGLDLADVKTFLDEVPKVPRSAFKDLKDAELSDIESDSGSELHFPVQPPSGPPKLLPLSTPSAPTIAPLFNQPCGSTSFFNNLRDRKVCLESAYMSDLKTIKGTVRVMNLDFNKKVLIRYTSDDWQSHTDVDATYLSGSCDGFSDKFSFSINYSSIAGKVGKRLEFCIKFNCANYEYWDNNSGKNYVFQCFGPSHMNTSVAGTRPINFSRPDPSRKSLPISTPVGHHPPSINRGHHFQNFSQSPGMHDDPWLRYL